MKLPHLVMAAAVSFAAGAIADEAKTQEQGMQQQSSAQGAGAQQQHDADTLRQVQQQLSEKGFDPGAADGVWGPQTESALKGFQQAQGIEPSGQLDQQTLSALGVDGAAAGGTAPSTPSESAPSGSTPSK